MRKLYCLNDRGRFPSFKNDVLFDILELLFAHRHANILERAALSVGSITMCVVHTRILFVLSHFFKKLLCRNAVSHLLSILRGEVDSLLVDDEVLINGVNTIVLQ